MIDSGFLYEIFESIQGEGIYCGYRHIFVRFAGCNLECGYCDTPAAKEEKPSICLLESGQSIDNPVSVEQIVEKCREHSRRAVSITGGEPLMQVAFLTSLMSALKDAGFTNHLETNGTLYRELSKVMRWTDVIAMDMKLPSTNGQAFWAEHAKFLRIASGTNVFVKAIVSADTTDQEILSCCEIIAPIDRHITLVIQPVTGPNTAPATRLMRLQDVASAHLTDVRVIPQCHNILGLK